MSKVAQDPGNISRLLGDTEMKGLKLGGRRPGKGNCH